MSFAMEASFKELLVTKGVMKPLIDFMEGQGIVSAKNFADYCLQVEHVKQILVDHVPETRGNRTQMMHLVGIWRDAAADEKLKCESRARGVDEMADIEAPLPVEEVDNLLARFEKYYNFSLAEGEILWSHLLNRLRKEIDRNRHQLIHISKVGSEREAGRSQAAKRFKLSDSVTATFNQRAGASRDVPDNYVFIRLLTILMVGGYALVGCFEDKKHRCIFAPPFCLPGVHQLRSGQGLPVVLEVAQSTGGYARRRGYAVVVVPLPEERPYTGASNGHGKG